MSAGESIEDACLREIREEVNLEVGIESHLTRINHAYSHFKIIMDIFICSYQSGEVVLNGPVEYRWVHYHELTQFPFPKANLKFIPSFHASASLYNPYRGTCLNREQHSRAFDGAGSSTRVIPQLRPTTTPPVFSPEPR